MKTLILTTVLALAPVCRGGEKAEPAYERAAITEVSSVGRAVDHWFVATRFGTGILSAISTLAATLPCRSETITPLYG